MEVKGKKYLVMVDRFSSYPFVRQLHTANTSSVINALRTWFRSVGWPKAIGSDGGPQFRGEFKEFCRCSGIKFELSSTHNPESNGLAEAGVKRIKYLMEKCRNKEEFEDELEALCNTPMSDGRPAPSTSFYGRALRSPSLPAYEMPLSEAETTSSTEGEEEWKPASGDKVRLYDRVKCRWNDTGVVLRGREKGLSFLVKKANGRTVIKPLRHLKPREPTKNECSEVKTE
jgi:hypothetical protein